MTLVSFGVFLHPKGTTVPHWHGQHKGELWVPHVGEDVGIPDSQHSLLPQTVWQFLQSLNACIGHGPALHP